MDKGVIKPGDLIVVVGGRTGKDGIHGATMSSQTERLESSAVQIGSPFIQKKMTDFIDLVVRRGLVKTLTDCGAGGLSSSVGELADFGKCKHRKREEELYKSYRETLEKYRIQNFDPFPVGIPVGVISKIVESMIAGFHFHVQYYHPAIPNPQMFLTGLRRDKLITDKDKRILNVWIKRGKE